MLSLAWPWIFLSMNIDIQLSPEGEVNSGGYIPRCEALRYISTALHTDPEVDSCFSIYQIRWIKKNASSISSPETFAKRRTVFPSIRKTVNIQGYSKLREPIKMCKNCSPLIW